MLALLSIYRLWHNWCLESKEDMIPARPLNPLTLLERGSKAAMEEVRLSLPSPALQQRSLGSGKAAGNQTANRREPPVRTWISDPGWGEIRGWGHDIIVQGEGISSGTVDKRLKFNWRRSMNEGKLSERNEPIGKASKIRSDRTGRIAP